MLKSLKTIRLSFKVILISIVLSSLSACGFSKQQGVSLEGIVGTASWQVTLDELPPKVTTDILQTQLNQVFQQVNHLIGSWDKTSEISQFNQSNSTDWFSVSPELATLVKTTLSLSQESGGLYDVTVGPLIRLWGFSAEGTSQDKVPTEAEIALAKAKVGYQKLQVRLEPPALRKTQPDVVVELASVADGFAADQASHYLDTLGVKNYMVEMAGEIRTRGLSPRGDAWRIAIEKPIEIGQAVQQGIQLPDAGLATSGDYRNFFTANGRRYSHTLDPLSGYPVQHRLASVSVLEDNTTLADGYATLLMAMGEERGKTFADEKGLKAFFIWRTDKGFDTYATQSFNKFILK